jgi:SAM-dependent methyltransferase
MYVSGEYLQNNPMWHVEDSPWKAKQILKILGRNNIAPGTICEVGCGAGEILAQLQHEMPEDCEFTGYELSPQAFELCLTRANDKLNFKLMNILHEEAVFFDLILLMDVIEHLEDYYSFLRELKSKSRYKVLHIPLDLSAQIVIRNSPLLESRRSVGHLHYFTKDMALQILGDLDYEVLDSFYTYTADAAPRSAASIKTIIAGQLRKLLFSVHKDLSVRILGGYSLMVLAR